MKHTATRMADGRELIYIDEVPAPRRGLPDRRELLHLVSPRRAAGRLKYLAGSESAMGAFLNDVLPEETARALRSA